MQAFLQTREMQCIKHNEPREYLNLASFMQDQRQLICKSCNFSQTNQIRLGELEEFLMNFDNEVNWFRMELGKAKFVLKTAKNLANQIDQIEQGLNQIEKTFQEKVILNQSIQGLLKNLNYQQLMDIISLLKQKQIVEQQILQKACICEKEILQNEIYSQAINVLNKANDELMSILKINQVRFITISPQIIQNVEQFIKQVEQDFMENTQVYDIQMNKTGLFLAVGSSKIENEDCYAYMWEIKQGMFKKLQALKGHQREVKSIFFNNDDYLFTGSIDSTIKIWARQQNTKIWNLFQTLESHKLAVNCIQLCNDSSQSFFASGSEELIIWKKDITKNNKWMEDSIFKNNTRIIQTLSFSQKSNNLMVGSDDRLISIYEYQYKKWQLKYQEKQDNKIFFICSTYENDFISYQIDGYYKVWKGFYKNQILEWEQMRGKDEGKIKKLSYSYSKRLLGVTYEDGKLKIYQIQQDGNKKEINIDQKNGDLLVMSYISPSMQQNRLGTFQNIIKSQSKFAILTNNKLQVYIEDVDFD